MEAFIPMFLFMCVAGVLILRPISKKLGLLVEVLAKERMAAAGPRDGRFGGLEDAYVERMASSLERLNTRMDHIDDRISFMERLLERPAATRNRLSG